MKERPNSGALFQNKRKAKDNHPDMTGPLNVTCLHCGCDNELEQSGWKKKDRSGDVYYSLSVRGKLENRPQNPTQHEPVRYGTVMDDTFGAARGDTFHEDFSF